MGRFEFGSPGFKNFKYTPWKANFDINTRSFQQLPPEVNTMIQKQRLEILRKDAMQQGGVEEAMKQSRHPMQGRAYATGSQVYKKKYTAADTERDLIEIGLSPEAAKTFGRHFHLVGIEYLIYRNNLDTINDYQRRLLKYKNPSVSASDFKSGLNIIFSKIRRNFRSRIPDYPEVRPIRPHTKRILQNQLYYGMPEEFF